MIKKYTNGSWSEVKYKKYGNKTEEFAEFPVTIKGDGNDLTDYSISGNMSQASGVSPTTPIQPSECGELETIGAKAGQYKIPISSGGENLFDGEVHEGYYNDSGVLVVDDSHVCHSNLIKSNYNTLYTIDGLWINIQANFSVCEWDKNKQFIRRSNRQIPTQRTITFSIGSDAVYFSIQIYTNYDYSNIMLNTGSTPLPYSPYNRATTPIYLGEVPTTRRIRKLVLDGTEEWRSQYGGYTLSTDTKVSGRDTVLSTHYIPSLTASDKTIYLNSTNVIIIFDSDYPTLKDFKAYLAAQYAAGTPVTIWYVLAEPKTGIVNEPLRKIGDYVDTLSMEQAGVQIPTLHGNTVIDVETTLKPSEMSLTYKTWSDANAKIYLNGAWTDTPTPPVTSVVYGWHVDPSVADSSNAVTYLEDAVGMTPAAMGASTFDYGSWEDAFFMPKPCMVRSNGEVAYYLDPNDYSKKADGTPSDVANPDFDGNAMMEWGKIWYKFAGGETDGEGYFYVSNVQVDDSYHCWCNYDSKDNITDHFYTAIYNGTGTTKLRSISGVALTSANGNGGTTVTQEVERATANNTTADVEWYTDVWADRLLINALLVLIGKSLNTQATFGRGLDTGSQTAKEAYVTGTLNDKGLFWGVTADGNSAVKVFGMENWWGCVWHRTAGCISVDRALKIKLTYGTADGSTAVGYNQTGSGYISDGTIPSSDNYVKAMAYNQYGYMADNVTGGSSSTYYADYFYQNTGTRYLLVGGSSADGVPAGAFYFSLTTAPSGAHWSVAASLSFKPLAMKG